MTAKTILIADDDASIRELLQIVLESHGYSVLAAENGDQLVRMAQEHKPDLLLVDLMMPQLDGYEAIRQLRNDTRTAHLPMLILTARATPDDVVTGFESGADDYIIKPFHTDELAARIMGHLRRAAQRPVHNPLTGLAGNVLLTEELKYRIKRDEPFALMYVDLNNFKAFNDTYGFARGDRVIKLVADVLVEAVDTYRSDRNFIGHIGGDDFAVITTPDIVQPLCQRIIQQFDDHVLELYDPEDRARGYLVGTDRQGVRRRFPITSLAIGVVTNLQRRFTDHEEISRTAAEMKHFAKTQPGSAYAIDTRGDENAAVAAERRGARLKTVLLIGPDEQMNQRLWRVLRGKGLRSFMVPGIVDAHSFLAHEPELDLIVVDTRLDESLWEICTDLGLGASDLRLMALTDMGNGQIQRQLVSACLQQPFTDEEFLDTVVALLQEEE